MPKGTTVSGTEEAGAFGRGTVMLALLSVIAVAFAGAFAWTQFLSQDESFDAPALSPESAEGASRRIGVAFDDAVGTWERFLSAGDGRKPRPPRLVLFSRGQPSPCAGADPASGPFYCPVDRTAAFDLEFIDMLERRMGREAAAGTALVVARVVAGHVQDALDVPDAARGSASRRYLRDHALQADCLAGAWAGMASGRLGTVPPGFYAKLMARGASVRDDPLRRGADPIRPLDIFAYEDAAAREAAFRTGLQAANPAVCPDPGPLPR